MNNFGLGLILNFTDNATAGLQGATGAFNDLNNSITALADSSGAEEALMRLSATAGIVGNSFYSIGQNITSVFTGVAQNIIDTGGIVKSALTQLSTLYGNNGVANYEAGQAMIDKIKEYAAGSIFSFESLLPSVIMLKANGIEAFDEIESSTGRARQTLMDYAADLAIFNPQMRNMYGTGVNAAMGALNEYIAEGNTISLKRGASLDINSLLGEDTADSIEERSRQIADLMEKLGMVGITANMAGSPMQRLTRMHDVLFNLVSDIANSGVYEKYSSLIERLTDYFFSIDQGELDNLAQVISNALTDLMGLLDYVLDVGIKVVDWIRNLVKENPALAEMIIKGTALAGVFFLLTGAGLKLISSLGMLRLSISMLFQTGITSGLKLAGVFKMIFLKILPLLALSKLIRTAWEKDLGGIREKVHTIIDSVGLIFDAFTDNTLSVDNFEKAKRMGLLPLIEAILQLKYHFGFFIDGVKKGISNFINILGNVFSKIMEFIPKISGLGNGITAFLEKITAPGLTDNWEQAGYIISQIVAWVGLLVTAVPPIIKAVKAVINILQIAWTIIKTIVNVIKIVVGLIKLIGYGLQAIGFLASAPVGIVLAVVAGVVALIALVYKFRDEIAAFLVELWWKVEPFFIAIGDWIKNAWNAIKDFFAGIGEGISNAWNATKDFFAKTGEVIKGVWEEIQQNPVYQFFAGLFHAIYGFIYMIGSAIVVAVVGLGAGIVNLGKTIGNAFVNAWNAIKNFVVNAGDYIKNLWNNIVEGAKIAVKAVGNFFVSLYNDYVAPVVDAVVNAWSTAVDWTQEHIIEPAAKAIDKFFKGIANAVEWLKEVFAPAFEAIKGFIVDALEAAYDAVKPILDWIAEAVGNVVDGIGKVIENVGGFFEGVGDFFIGVGDTAREMVGLSTGGYVKTTGIAVLHPNEVVVNDTLTKGLGSFLNDYESNKATPKEQSAKHSDNSGVLLNGIKNIVESDVHSLTNAIKDLNMSSNIDKEGIINQIGQLLNATFNSQTGNDLMTKDINATLNSLINVIADKDINIDTSELYKHSENSGQKLFNAIQQSVDKLNTTIVNSEKGLVETGINTLNTVYSGIKESIVPIYDILGSLREISALNNSGFIDSIKVFWENTSQKLLSKPFDIQVISNNDVVTKEIISGTNIINTSLNQIGDGLLNKLEVLKTELIKGYNTSQTNQDIIATPPVINYNEMLDSESIIGYLTEGINTIQLSIIQVGDKVLNGLTILTSEVIKGVKSPLISQDIIATDDYSEITDSDPVIPYIPPTPETGNTTTPNEEITNYTTENKTFNQSTVGDTHIDNSVTFEAGSIVFNIDKDTDLSNLSDEDLRIMADKIFAIISRKLQIRSMQTRK